MKNKSEKEKMITVINYFNFKYQGDWDSTYAAVQRKETIEVDELKAFIKDDEMVKYISIIDECYPENYKSIWMPPLIIYYSGNKKILKNQEVISLWGFIDESSFKQVMEKNKVLAMEWSEHNIELAKTKATNDIKIIIVDVGAYDQLKADELKEYPNIIYISEIPYNSRGKYQQNGNRMLLGISNKSVFINKEYYNPIDFAFYEGICKLEHQQVTILGELNKEILEHGKRYK